MAAVLSTRPDTLRGMANRVPLRRALVTGAAVLAALLVAAPASAAAPRTFGSLIEAESFDAQHGVQTLADPAASGGHAIALGGGDWVRFDAVEFGDATQASGFATWRSCATGSGTVELRLDSPTATPFLVLSPAAGGCAQWYKSSLRLGLATTPLGTHDLYLTARAGSSRAFYRLDSFQMIQQTANPIP
jgi:Carbohydrate binding module (family 6)